MVLPPPADFGGGFPEPAIGEASTENGLGEEEERGRAERGGEGTDSGFGEEQRERGRCCGGEEEQEGSSLGGLGEALLLGALGEVVREMGEAEGECSRRGCVRRARGLELAARPVDWMTLRCCWRPSALDLEAWKGKGEAWARDRAGGDGERGREGTRVGGSEEKTLWSLLSPAPGRLSILPGPEVMTFIFFLESKASLCLSSSSLSSSSSSSSSSSPRSSKSLLSPPSLELSEDVPDSLLRTPGPSLAFLRGFLSLGLGGCFPGSMATELLRGLLWLRWLLLLARVGALLASLGGPRVGEGLME